MSTNPFSRDEYKPPTPEPFASTNLGIAVNTVTGLPAATFTVAKDIARGIARGVFGTGLSVGNAVNVAQGKDITTTYQPTNPVAKFIFGDDPVHDLATRTSDLETSIKGSGFAQRMGLDKYALPLAFGGIIADSSLNLTPFGGAEKNVLKELTKQTTVEGTTAILRSLKIPEEFIPRFASEFSKTGTVEETKSIFDTMKGVTGMKTIAEGAEKAAPAVSSESGQLLDKQPQFPTGSGQIPPSTLSESGAVVSSSAEKGIAQETSAVKNITDALKAAEPVRGQQETLYTAERGQKIVKAMEANKVVGGGEAGYYAKLSQLSGEMAKVQFDSLRGKIGQEDINTLFKMVDSSPKLGEFDKVSAGNGLARLLGQAGSTLPTESQLTLLAKVFPDEMIKAVLAKRPLLKRLGDLGLQLINLPKSLEATGDVSFGLRQGLYTATRYPKQFASSFVNQFKWFGSEKAFNALQASFEARPSFDLMRESKLALTDVGTSIFTAREEQFQSALAEKIPIIGRLVKASNRAYTGFANKLRADVFDHLVQSAINLGRNPYKDRDLALGIAGFVNDATGRGSLGRFEQSAKLLSSAFFSPRLIASRMRLLFTPITYATADPFVRKEAWKAYLSFFGAAGTMLGVANLSGVKVGLDSNSADFGKLIFGKTRLDLLGGFGQYIRALSQITTGKYTSSVSGKKLVLGEGYKPLTRFDIAERLLESKSSPAASIIVSLLKGQDYTGQKLTASSLAYSKFVPLAFQDVIDVLKSDPSLLPVGLTGFLGAGVQTYLPTGKPKKNPFSR